MSTYTYDSANRLATVHGPSSTVWFAYNGLGDRLAQTVNGQTTPYTLDLASGLTQVLADGENVYLYGLARLAQVDSGTPEYFLGDALGSVRQLTDESGEITLTRAYDPYGAPTQTIGPAQTPYGFTGEWTDVTGLVYLRARYYASWQGRFVSRDVWEGDMFQPLTLNGWNYVKNNPVNIVDPSGYYPQDEVHFQLTFNLALQEAQARCPLCLVGLYGQGIPRWVARGDERIDVSLWYHLELHFKSYEDAWSDVRRMIETGDPYLVGAALHGLQDYWSHTYEGYPLSGHASDSILAGCTLWSGSPCQRPPNAELAILLSLWVEGEIESPTRRALLMKVRFYVPDIPISADNITSLTTSNLFDIWLRQQPGSPETRKAAYWKDKYGYDTDTFYPFTQRDQLMINDTRKALREYFDTLSDIDLCVFDRYYSPPSDEEIVDMLNSGSGK